MVKCGHFATPSGGKDFDLILSADRPFFADKKLSADNLAIPVRRPRSDMIKIFMIQKLNEIYL